MTAVNEVFDRNRRDLVARWLLRLIICCDHDHVVGSMVDGQERELEFYRVSFCRKCSALFVYPGFGGDSERCASANRDPRKMNFMLTLPSWQAYS